MEMTLNIYSKKDCCLCEEAKKVLQSLTKEYEIHINEIDIYSDEALIERYGMSIPVVTYGEIEIGSGFIHKDVIIKFILSAYKG